MLSDIMETHASLDRMQYPSGLHVQETLGATEPTQCVFIVAVLGKPAADTKAARCSQATF